MAFYSGRVGPCRWACIVGKTDDATVDAFLANLRDVVDHLEPGSLVLDLAHGVTLPSAKDRKAIAEIIASAPKSHMIAGHALVTTSPIARGVLTSINWIVRRRFPEEIFGIPEQGAAWLAGQNSDLDATALLRDVADHVEGWDRIRW